VKKETSFSTRGQRADIGNIAIYRILANRYADKVGPFVFLDHIAPAFQNEVNKSGTGAHPHRGIATLTYVISGEVEHLDSRGNHQKVHSGGIQWMKAGNGIIHDEILNADSQTGKNTIHAFQFWINLPPKIKEEEPQYMAIHGSAVPKRFIGSQGSSIKVIAGEYQELRSAIPDYSGQFLYHIQLQANDKLEISFDQGTEVAAFLPTADAVLNNAAFKGENS
jgi:redox-sensitive bicupin YhaK (pirin superfamily)